MSNVANPGVSAIYELLSILYNSTVVVVFFLFILLLIVPSSAILSLNIPFIKVDFPTPELPEKQLYYSLIHLLLIAHFLQSVHLSL